MKIATAITVSQGSQVQHSGQVIRKTFEGGHPSTGFHDLRVGGQFHLALMRENELSPALKNSAMTPLL